MKDVLKEFKSFFENHKISLKSKFLIGVSGGVDSMATLNLALETKLDIEVAHINYQLRGEENNKEYKLINEFCNKYSVTLHSKKTEINSLENIQIKAREIRYEFFNDVLAGNDLDYVITAHHKNDNHETFFLNTIRGSGLKGLKGIPEKRGKVIRPVLHFTKNELLNYAQSKNIPFNHDSSNLENKYNRNFIRNEIIHKLTKRFPSYEKGLTKSIENINKDYLLLRELINKIISPYIEKKEEKIFIYYNNDIPEHCWFYFFQDFGFNFDQITSWLKTNHQSGKQILSAEFRLIKDRNCWIISPIKKNIVEDNYELKKFQNIDFPIKLKISKERAIFPIETKSNIGIFNLNKVTLPLTIRKWKNGDYMTPLGMKGKKKISDILTDKKVSIVNKENIYVIISNQEIIWLIGYCVSEKYKVEQIQKNVLKIIFSNE